MASIPDIVEVRSFSRFGLSVVTVVFKEDVKIYWARQQVAERLAEARSSSGRYGHAGNGTAYHRSGKIYQYVIHTKKGYEKI